MYSGDAQENIVPQLTGTVHERIHQLESLVISLIRQGATVPESTPVGVSTSDPPNGSPHTNHTRSEGSRSPSPLPVSVSGVTPSTFSISTISAKENANTSSVPLDGGYMKYNNIGAGNYVGSSHWAAVLNSISELKGNVEEEEIRSIETHPQNPVSSSLPGLLYGCQRATKAEILSSMPPRRAADRLVSRYLTLDIPSGKSTILKFEIYEAAVTDMVITNGAYRDFSSRPVSY
jgi:hypothetical protein